MLRGGDGSPPGCLLQTMITYRHQRGGAVQCGGLRPRGSQNEKAERLVTTSTSEVLAGQRAPLNNGAHQDSGAPHRHWQVRVLHHVTDTPSLSEVVVLPPQRGTLPVVRPLLPLVRLGLCLAGPLIQPAAARGALRQSGEGRWRPFHCPSLVARALPKRVAAVVAPRLNTRHHYLPRCGSGPSLPCAGR